MFRADVGSLIVCLFVFFLVGNSVFNLASVYECEVGRPSTAVKAG